MSPHLPLEAPSRLPRDYRRTLTVAVVLVGILGPPFAYVYAIDRRLDTHLTGLEAKRQQMDDYVSEERAARCASARNVYRLCLAARIDCEPVEARCRP
jgi:hypothetical protein